jgi:hypothetical protein
MAVEAKLNAKTLEPDKAGEHYSPACNHVLGALAVETRRRLVQEQQRWFGYQLGG